MEDEITKLLSVSRKISAMELTVLCDFLVQSKTTTIDDVLIPNSGDIVSVAWAREAASFYPCSVDQQL